MIKNLPDKLGDLLQAGRLTIFSVTYCPYCNSALSTLKSLKIDFQYIECDTANLSGKQTEDLHKLSGFRTYPKIFIGKECIGGNDDMKKKIKNGIFFEKLLKEQIVFSKENL